MKLCVCAHIFSLLLLSRAHLEKAFTKNITTATNVIQQISYAPCGTATDFRSGNLKAGTVSTKSNSDALALARQTRVRVLAYIAVCLRKARW